MTFPNVKIQSNFTFNNAATGDPSTFTFTMDAFPGYTWFNKTRKVLLAMQVMDDIEGAVNDFESVFPHTDDEVIDDLNADPPYFQDSVNGEQPGPTPTPVPVTAIAAAADPTTISITADTPSAITVTITPADADDKTVKYAATGITLYSDAACTTALALDTAVENLTVYAKGDTTGTGTITVTANADATKTATVEVEIEA